MPETSIFVEAIKSDPEVKDTGGPELYEAVRSDDGLLVPNLPPLDLLWNMEEVKKWMDLKEARGAAVFYGVSERRNLTAIIMEVSLGAFVLVEQVYHDRHHVELVFPGEGYSLSRMSAILEHLGPEIAESLRTNWNHGLSYSVMGDRLSTLLAKT